MLEQFIEWYLELSKKVKSTNELFNAFVEYLNRNHFFIIRAALGAKTLHPQVESMAYLWIAHSAEQSLSTQVDPLSHSKSNHHFSTGRISENRFKLGSLRSSQFNSSPIFHVLKTAATYYYSFTENSNKDFPFPILKELSENGATGYLAVPIIHTDIPLAYLSLATEKPNGFSLEERNFLEKAMHLFSLKWFSFLQTDLTENLLNIYLGKSTGTLVHSGKIYRGDLEKINSIIWFSDIRDYSGISEKLSPEDTIELLNEYFGCVIPVLEANGGEVLKLLGDGILAVFPFEEGSKRRVGFKALIAVRRAFKELGILNERRQSEGKIRILHGVGIHMGKIMYGNIGSEDRLDFTVIGEAVNLTSRIAGMCGQLKKAVLASEEFATEIAVKWEQIGVHKLKGIAKEQTIFGIPEELEM